MGSSSEPIPPTACGKSGHLTVLSVAAISRISNTETEEPLTGGHAPPRLGPLHPSSRSSECATVRTVAPSVNPVGDANTKGSNPEQVGCDDPTRGRRPHGSADPAPLDSGAAAA